MSDKSVLHVIAQSPKTAALTSAVTTGSGFGTFFDWLPSDIGKLGALIGIGLSIVLIRAHIINIKKSHLDIEIKRNQIKIQQHELDNLNNQKKEQ